MRKLGIALLVGSIAGGALFTPAGAHISREVSHLWNNHIRPLSDARYLNATLRPGETVRGSIGARYEATGHLLFATNESLPAAAPSGLDDAHVTVDGEDESQNECSGTFDAPTAAPGFVCIYIYNGQNYELPEGFIYGKALDGAAKWGFQLEWFSQEAGSTWVMGTWAYRAP